MACRAIELKLGKRKLDDKDHFKNKRLKLAGPLLADLFRVAFRNLCRDIKYQLERMGAKRRRLNISIAVRPGIISNRLKHALATGNWGMGRVGITQLLDRTNRISALSHLRRVQSPLSRSQPNFALAAKTSSSSSRRRRRLGATRTPKRRSTLWPKTRNWPRSPIRVAFSLPSRIRPRTYRSE